MTCVSLSHCHTQITMLCSCYTSPIHLSCLPGPFLTLHSPTLCVHVPSSPSVPCLSFFTLLPFLWSLFYFYPPHTHTHVSLWDADLESLEYKARSGVTGSQVISVYSFGRTPKLTSRLDRLVDTLMTVYTFLSSSFGQYLLSQPF